MRRPSLRLRLIAGGVAAILIALAVAGAGLTLLFERHVARTMADDLDVHLKQLLAAIDAEGRLVLRQLPTDPRFSDPLSGLYWQVSSDRGDLLRSRSLWDTTLALPADEPSPEEAHRHELSGPGDTRVLVAERRISLNVGGERVPVRIAVAADLARVSAAATAFARDLAIALGLLGLVLAIGTSIQVMLGLRSLAALRRGVADVRAGRLHRLPATVPVEVGPLVEEVNALLDMQDYEIERSRGRAADLAHGLKTPLAALVSDANRLHQRGEHVIAREIEGVANAMGRHVDRELARARLRGTAHRGPCVSAEVAPLVRSLIATLERTQDGSRITFDSQIAAAMKVALDRVDLAEVLGNLLDNAARHARSCVRVTSSTDVADPWIAVEDDGAGIAPAARAGVLATGARLDERGETGLGLAIVQDVLTAYAWRLALGTSELGGLKATVAPTASLAVASSLTNG
jgi:signal transduction histidine kinase